MWQKSFNETAHLLTMTLLNILSIIGKKVKVKYFFLEFQELISSFTHPKINLTMFLQLLTLEELAPKEK